MNDEILGYHFTNPYLLKEALTHPSICIVNKKDKKICASYERLEFLGDSVLNFVISELLMQRFPSENEGDLAKRRANLVAGEALTKLAQIKNLGKRIEMTDAEAKLGGRENSNNLEDVLEAIIGAIYLDSGFAKLKPIIYELWSPLLDNMPNVPHDPKSKLQEILQKKGRAIPNYELIAVEGPGHMLVFKVRLSLKDFKEVIGTGKSKQQAEKEAAILLLEQINE